MGKSDTGQRSVGVGGGGGGGGRGGDLGRRGRGVRSIFYTPAQPQRSSRLEGRRHTRQESRGESVSLRSTRLWGGDLHSVRAASAGHIETDAHEPIGLSAARLRSQFFFFFFCRLFVSEFTTAGLRPFAVHIPVTQTVSGLQHQSRRRCCPASKTSLRNNR